jgi:hypothetical protein
MSARHRQGHGPRSVCLGGWRWFSFGIVRLSSTVAGAGGLGAKRIVAIGGPMRYHLSAAPDAPGHFMGVSLESRG